MLQQILDEMWIDPDLLAELDETQKQTLFCKMREEQVRRWKMWDSTNPPQPPENYNNEKNKRKVDFLIGEDGEPWTWVMGEHPNDKSIEQILEEEAREAARKLAEKETQSLRLSVVEAELTELLELNKKQLEEIETRKQMLDSAEDIYCSADELRIAAETSFFTKRDALQEITFNKQQNVSQRVALWEKRLMDERTSEHFKRIQRKKQEAVKEAEEAENKHEQFWREQQRKAKEAEQQMREIARRAREEHRRSILESEPLPQGNQNLPGLAKERTGVSKPPNKDAIVEWFRSSQANRRAGLEPNTNAIAPWFHGLITRQEAESLLQMQPVGSFLVRVSERIWGYAISYRDTDRCKHYLIDASNGTYQFLGNNQKSHNTLGDLIRYHGLKPITADGGELLDRPCHRSKPLPPAFQPMSIRAR
ncbi:SH2 domain-containing protein 4B isoform X2 [Halyomorpha halys]|nr:SH2 domain-containing protein 4B isoform X2 [Halyomorpha halys]XP_014282800.1 SH2 domain-containing protein 4B isoform X2 [Halyomorpha halys]